MHVPLFLYIFTLKYFSLALEIMDIKSYSTMAMFMNTGTRNFLVFELIYCFKLHINSEILNSSSLKECTEDASFDSVFFLPPYHSG